jgi:translocator assembly and maintenance protein 41
LRMSNNFEEYRQLLNCLPLDTISYAFAYGSGAISQQNEDLSEKMVDFIIVSNDSSRFHKDNISQNSKHYSFVKLFGPDKLTTLQKKFGARLYYNTNVRSNNRLIKYGVISTDDFQADLLDWSWLYVAGRLQKPVLEVIHPSDSISSQIKENRKNALQAALLQLPDSFTLEKLFQHIVGLSYHGDFRMVFGEDRKKIEKIVKGGYAKFETLYKPLLADDKRLSLRGNKVEQDNSTPSIYHRLNLLPMGVVDGLCIRFRAWDKRQRDVEEVLFSMAHRHDVGEHVAGSMASIVSASSIRQTAKNALTAGVVKSVVYSSKKVFKMFRSIR